MSARRGRIRLLMATALVVGLSGCSAQASAVAEEATVSAAQTANDPAAGGSSSAPADPVPADPARAPAGPVPADPARAPGGPGPGGPAAADQAAIGRPGAQRALTPPPGSGPRTGLPAGVAEPPAATGQLVTVTSSGPGATSATLRAWERQPTGGWRATMAPLTVRVGTDGVGRASESARRTPAGSYPLEQAFGRAPDPGTKLPYRHVGNDDWWVSDTHSPAYNTYRHCRIGTCPFNESAGENLGQAGASYDYAVVIGYNTARPVAGAGSAFFLHVDAGAASAGCVEVPRATVVSLLRWLDPARHPRITIAAG